MPSAVFPLNADCSVLNAYPSRPVQESRELPPPSYICRRDKMSTRYAQWMYDWETRLTSVDNNRVVRPLEWGPEWT